MAKPNSGFDRINSRLDGQRLSLPYAWSALVCILSVWVDSARAGHEARTLSAGCAADEAGIVRKVAKSIKKCTEFGAFFYKNLPTDFIKNRISSISIICRRFFI